MKFTPEISPDNPDRASLTRTGHRSLPEVGSKKRTPAIGRESGGSHPQVGSKEKPNRGIDILYQVEQSTGFYNVSEPSFRIIVTVVFKPQLVDRVLIFGETFLMASE